jgi:hypothetical protein
MNRPTLATFRAQFPSEAMGICQADTMVATYCNDAQDRLLLDPMAPDEGWWGGTVRLNLSALVVNHSAYVVVPREIGRLVGIGLCDHPVMIRNGFYEYLQFGAGLQPKQCGTGWCNDQLQAYERDNVVTFSPLLSTPQLIRVYPSDTRDTARRVLIQGRDQNSKVVLTTDPNTGQSAPGEYLQLAFPFSTSVNQFSTISGIQKDQTYGPLEFFQVDPGTGAEVALSAMDPNEGAASYRRYLINGIPSQKLCCITPGAPLQLSAIGRLDFIPVSNETDYLTIQCVPALTEEAQSIRFSRMDSSSASQQSMLHHARALALLNGQLDAFEGKVNTAISVPIFGSARLRPQPI